MPLAEEVEALREIAALGALHGLVEVSTGQLAEILGTSQQTASRRILDLERVGYVRREMGVRKQLIRLTEEGVNVLGREYAAYKRLFDHRDQLQIKGVVASGSGEGAYYLSQQGYIQQFREKLGFVPYPGTLNLKIDHVENNKLRVLRSAQPLRIEEFHDQGRSFGSVDAWPAEVQNVRGALILPHRTHHAGTVEIIAPEFLRGKLSLQDGDEVEILVRL